MTNVAAVNVTAAGVLQSSPAVLSGVVLTNTGTAGTVRIYDNATTNSGTVLFTAYVGANSFVHFVYPGNGVQAIKGLYLSLGAGVTVDGSVQIA